MARFEERQAIPAEQLRGLLAFYDGDIEGLAETHVLRIDHEDIDPLRSSSEPVEHLVQLMGVMEPALQAQLIACINEHVRTTPPLCAARTGATSSLARRWGLS